MFGGVPLLSTEALTQVAGEERHSITGDERGEETSDEVKQRTEQAPIVPLANTHPVCFSRIPRPVIRGVGYPPQNKMSSIFRDPAGISVLPILIELMRSNRVHSIAETLTVP